MQKALINGVLIMLIIVILSCLVSIMVLFIGGNLTGPDLGTLVQIQSLSVPAGIAVIIWTLASVGRGTLGERIKTLYAAMPQWLIFSAVVLNLLVASGELALITVAISTDQEVSWIDHVALVSMLASSLAFCFLYGHSQRLSGRHHAFSGRW